MAHLNWRGSRHSPARTAAGATEGRQGLALSSHDWRLPVGRALICGVMLTLSIMLLPANAFGLGRDRPVERPSCGWNHVSSGSTGAYSWAETRKQSGSYAGRLSVALRYSDGYETQRFYGSSSNAYIIASGSLSLVCIGVATSVASPSRSSCLGQLLSRCSSCWWRDALIPPPAAEVRARPTHRRHNVGHCPMARSPDTSTPRRCTALYLAFVSLATRLVRCTAHPSTG